MTYHPPIAEMTRTARRLGQDRLAATARYAEATPSTREAILTEVARLATDILAPLNRPGDRHPAVLENGVVRTSPGYAEGYRAIAEGGWIGIAADPQHGGLGLPQSLAVMVSEMMASACLSISLCPLLSQGQIEAIEHHASEGLKALYLPPLVAGRWTGTMNLTEPQAGSDVGALRAKATPNADGSYAVTGQKIWISWGDHDMAENVIHLVLARLPDAPAGSRGISLFLVPKILPEDDAGAERPRLGQPNRVRCLSLEHKMGLHGSPTAVMEFDGATGWLVGEPNRGLACMFTMMNNARLQVGIQGVAIAEAATQAALAWASDRVQGRTPDGDRSILGHADVRRMLMRMKAQTRVARAIAYDCAFALDMGHAAADPAERAAQARRGALLTPIAKAYGTDTGIEVANLAVQVHGGAGYCEDTGVAQYARDVRITAIYEGTNGIQAMDLVGRKLTGDDGAALDALLAEIEATADAARAAGLEAEATALTSARSKAAGVMRWMLGHDDRDRAAGAGPFLHQLATVLGGHYLLRAALDGGDEERALAAYWCAQALPQAHADAQAATAGAAQLYALDAETLAATV
ncbi:MAG: acyl-CoA dehydrogenase family protein [Pseudomonadota bacterium]